MDFCCHVLVAFGINWSKMPFFRTYLICIHLCWFTTQKRAFCDMSLSQALILTKTPAGTTRRLSDSTVRAFGSVMSIIRL